MPNHAKNYLGIDYGHVRLGLAVAQAEAKLATPLTTLQKLADPSPILRQVIEEQNIGTVVVGLPRGLDGQETVQTAAVRRFIESLLPLNLPVIVQDEAGTSSLAKERIGSGASRSGEIDSEAAAIILQDYLNNLPADG